MTNKEKREQREKAASKLYHNLTSDLVCSACAAVNAAWAENVKNHVDDSGEPMPPESVQREALEKRYRNWGAVVYPESAPEGWQDILKSLKIDGFISPLHDKDVNPTTGAPKKAHYHVLLMFPTMKTFSQASEVWQQIGAVPDRISVQSVRGNARYLVHLDNPEKFQYDKRDIVQLGGADWEAVTHLPTDDYEAVKSMCAFIRANQIYSFSQFFDICVSKYDDWANMLIKGGVLGIVKEYIRSCYWEDTNAPIMDALRRQLRNVDIETGEITE